MEKVKIDYSFLDKSLDKLLSKIEDVNLNSCNISSTTKTPNEAYNLLSCFNNANKILNDNLIKDIESLKKIGTNYSDIDKYLADNASSLGLDITAKKLIKDDEDESNSEEKESYYSAIEVPSGGSGYVVDINGYDCKIIVDEGQYEIYLDCSGHEDNCEAYCDEAFTAIINQITSEIGYPLTDTEIGLVKTVLSSEKVDDSCYEYSININGLIVKKTLSSVGVSKEDIDSILEDIANKYGTKMEEK